MMLQNYNIPFNKPHLTGKEVHYIYDAAQNGQLSGNGRYTKLCQNFLKERYGFGKCLLTTSCTDALEMAAILLGIKEGDEVIMPSYTFVSTANAFVLRGAKIVFVDSGKNHPGMDEELIESLITPKTKAIVPVHYAGVACKMERIMQIAEQYNLFVVEDAAQAIDSYYLGNGSKKQALGTIGHLATFSFHETKNIISGEGGMLAINDPQFEGRAEIVWEKGTNRSAFFRKEVDKYGWVDVGSSFLPSEIVAAFLYAQLEALDQIQEKRKHIWETYYDKLTQWAVKHNVGLPYVPPYATNNGHLFYLVFENSLQREKMINHLKSCGVLSVFHYLSLHKSPFYAEKYSGQPLRECDRYSETLLRLPLYYDLSDMDLNTVIEAVTSAPF